MLRPGAIYYNGFFPGFIGVPQNSAFPVHVQGIEAMLHIVRHLAPVVVTDFGNDFLPLEKEGGQFTSLKRPIETSPTNTIGAVFRAVDGIEPGEFFCTKEHDYAIYRKQSFTEVTVGAETQNAEDPNSISPAIFNKAIDEFLQLYRIVTRDVWVLRPDRLQRNVPIIRTRAVVYVGPILAATRQERLIDHIPERFQPIIFSVQEYAADLPAMRHDPADAALRLGHFLATETRLSDAQSALLDCFEMLMATRSFRFALIESFAIAEAISFDYVERLRRRDQKLDACLKKEEKKSRLTMRFLINSIFPQALHGSRAEFPDLIRNLDVTRKLRDGTLHRGESVRKEDAERSLNATQQLIFAIESPPWVSSRTG
jgi:hypothetical protein